MVKIRLAGLIGALVGTASMLFPILWFRADFPTYFLTNFFSIVNTYLWIPLVISLSLSFLFSISNHKWYPQFTLLCGILIFAVAFYAPIQSEILIQLFLSSKSLTGNYRITIGTPSYGWFGLLFSGTILCIPICMRLNIYEIFMKYLCTTMYSLDKKWGTSKKTLIWLVPFSIVSVVAFIQTPFLLSGLGMIAIGILFVFYWKNKTAVMLKFFGFGTAAWLLTVALKFAFAIIFNQPMANMLQTFLPASLADPLLWLYTGLLTGIFECGGVLLLSFKTRIKEMDWNETIAFGIGFGGIEAILLGLVSLVSNISASSAEVSLMVIPMPIVERIAAMLIHIFSNVLIIFTVQSRRWGYFWESFSYKTAVDSTAAFGILSYGVESLPHMYILELIFTFFGLIGFVGLVRLKQKFERTVTS